MKIGPFETHPAADLFPLMGGDEFRLLVEDIGKHGCHEPIVLDPQGRLLDGRNRVRACLEAGRKWKRSVVSQDGLVEYVISLNLRRRNLSKSQVAAIGAEMLPMLEAEARERMERGKTLASNEARGKSADQAASIVGCCRAHVERAKLVKERDPGAFEKIKAGAATVGAEYDRLRPRRKPKEQEQEPRPEAQPKTFRGNVGNLRTIPKKRTDYGVMLSQGAAELAPLVDAIERVVGESNGKPVEGAAELARHFRSIASKLRGVARYLESKS